ncbi:hypothetical protein GGF38_004606, partial [Coemansia sp. RSA 25]
QQAPAGAVGVVRCRPPAARRQQGRRRAGGREQLDCRRGGARRQGAPARLWPRAPRIDRHVGAGAGHCRRPPDRPAAPPVAVRVAVHERQGAARPSQRRPGRRARGGRGRDHPPGQQHRRQQPPLPPPHIVWGLGLPQPLPPRPAADCAAALRLRAGRQRRRGAAGDRGVQDQEPEQLFHRALVAPQGQRVGIQALVSSHHREAGPALRRPPPLCAKV